MNVPYKPADQQEHQISTAHSEINLVDWLAALMHRWKLVLGLPISFTICALLVSFSMVDVYRATTKILPSQQSQSNATGLLNHLGGFAGTVPSVPNIRIPIELHVSIIKSRVVADSLIQRFNLKKIYDVESVEAARDLLTRNSTITATKDGLIIITVEDTDPRRAAQIANTYVEELLKHIRTMALTEASHRRLFFERRLQMSKANLTEMQIALQAMQNTRGALIGAKEIIEIEIIARLRAQISAKEIELSAIRAFVTIKEYSRELQELGALHAELAKVANNKTQYLGEKGGKLAILDNAKILHDVKYYERLSELLMKQYEAARLDEAKDSSAVEVLDWAVEPERSIRPNRVIIVLNCALFGLLIVSVGVLLFDVIQIKQRLRQAVQLAKLKS